ncbi:MAG: hypothetical protein CMK89_18935 [Pseudomonadales bacterium]|nr:hypothetical protein [Pseudomonadales bacterium]
MAKKIRLIGVLLMVVLCVSCASSPSAGQAEESYTPDTCTHFFDGCNKCTRAPGAEMAACTRMACMEYQKPVCLDAPQ